MGKNCCNGWVRGSKEGELGKGPSYGEWFNLLKGLLKESDWW